MVLAVNTEEGQRMMQDQQKALDMFAYRFPKLSYVQTATSGDNAGAIVDALVIKDNTLSFVAEVKTRYVTHHKFTHDYENHWLLSYKKILQVTALCDMLQIPFWGLLYLQPDDVLLYIKIYDPLAKDYVCDYGLLEQTVVVPIGKETKTEICAFIDMSTAFVIGGRQHDEIHSLPS